jgi:drug/metabolite transporter (DMT)-like permease
MAETREQRWRAVGVLFLGASVIGLAPILVRLGDAGPAAVGFWRLTLALPMLAVMVRLGQRRSGGEGEGQGAFSPFVLAAGTMFFLDIASWHYGIAMTSVANATVLTNLTPVVVTLIAWLVFRERPNGLFVICVVVALAGASLMAMAPSAHAMVNGRAGVNPPPHPALGNLLSTAASLWYALYFISVGRARRSMSPSRVMLWSSGVCAPLLLVFAIAMREPLTPASLGGWAACAGLAVMHVTGQGSIAWALGRLPTATASMVVLVQPVVAAVLGWAILHEPLGLWQSVGGLVALTGVVASQWVSAPTVAAPAPAPT